MTEESTTTMFTESPASWNTRYISPDGFTCQLTLRAETGRELLERANGALAFLREHGCIPSNGYSKQQESEHNQVNNQSSNKDDTWCSIHNVEMKRWEKDGRVWYSHKNGDGWCSGKAKNGK